MVSRMASEGSVSYLPDMREYVLVYTEGGLSDRLLARTAPEPIGPWSASTVIYRCPEPGRDKRIFCYGAKWMRIPGVELIAACDVDLEWAEGFAHRAYASAEEMLVAERLTSAEN
jgi:hypothetical protein